MRIDRLELGNFKKFEELTFELHPQFTLLVGENGSGKTSVLDALSVAAGIWLVEAPDSTLNGSGRNILESEIRLEPGWKGDRVQFQECRPVVIRATGRIGDHEQVVWTRQIRPDGKRTSNAEAKDALAYVKETYARDSAGVNGVCPVLAYYGAGRAWLPSNERVPKPKTNGPARRWGAFYDCFNERIRFAELQKWFSREASERGNRGGRWRPGFEVVRRAVVRCVPEADDVWFDTDRDQIVLSLAGKAQPFNNLSAGQRMMLALVADLSIKAVTQNAFLLPPDELGADEPPLPRLLQLTSGVVLIDELDVHLHPRWQRRVATDLKRTFPAIQFVCTSHSPQVIGEVNRDEVRLLREDGSRTRVEHPPVARGADSNWILDHVMEGAASKTPDASALEDAIEDELAAGNLMEARAKLGQMRALLDGETGKLVRLESSLESLEALAVEASRANLESENH